MILKLTDLICTRYAVEQLAKQHVDVVEVDFSGANIAGASTMHQFMLSFPDAALTGLEGWNKTLYEMVLDTLDTQKGQS